MSDSTYQKKVQDLKQQLEAARKSEQEHCACLGGLLDSPGHHAECACERCTEKWMARVDLNIATSHRRAVEHKLLDLVTTHDRLQRERPMSTSAKKGKVA